MRLVRYADDAVMTFERGADARAMRAALGPRLAKFGLELHADKTRLIEFGRKACEWRRRRGEGRPETFDFLGFTHYCARTRRGRFMALRKTQRRRMIAKLKALRQAMRRRMHTPVGKQQAWLNSVLRGHYAYYGITGNSRSINQFRTEVLRAWRYVLMRRGNRSRMYWDRFNALLRRFPLAPARIVHVWRYQ